MAKIKGNKKDNKLIGTNHDDDISGRGGDDLLKGKGGNDLLDGGKGFDKLLGGGGDDSLLGGIFDDTLKGGKGNDTLDGGDGNDTMDGGDGDDLMIAGPGGDFFVGGAGIDTVDFTASDFRVDVELLTMTSTFDGLQDAFSGIENIDGSAFDDDIEGDGSANHFRGFAGNDQLKGGAGNDTLDGGEGDDQIFQDSGGDDLIGGNGFDSLVYEDAGAAAVINLATGIGGGSAVGDTFSGFERVFGTDFGDAITGSNSAAEVLFGEGGNDSLRGNGKDDTLFGDAGRDNLYGDAGDDRLSPEGDIAEVDHLFGGSGSDWADYDNAGAAVTVHLNTGTSGGQAAGDTYDSVENVQGSDFGDQLSAGTNGRAYGGWGDDFIYDGGGTNVLRGERGDDHLIDDGGFLHPEDGLRDNFVFEVGLGVDTIQGFDQSSGGAGDRIWLPEAQFSDLNFNGSGILAAGQVLNLPSSHGATIAGAQLIFQQNTETLYYDADGTGSGAAVAIGKILGLAAIANSDFVVVPNL